MRENGVIFFRPRRPPRRRRVHDPVGNVFRPFVTRLIRAAAASRTGRLGVACGTRFQPVDRQDARSTIHQPFDFASEFADSLARARGDRNHGAAQLGTQFFHVNVNAIPPGHVHHVQRHDDGAIQLQNLTGEKQIPFKIRRVHDDQRRVWRGVSVQPSAQRVAGQFFLRRGAFQPVKPRQIHQDDLLAADFGSANPPLGGGAGKVGGLGAQSGQRVEQRGLARVGIADQRERKGAMRQRRRAIFLATAGRRNLAFPGVAHAQSFSRRAQWPGRQISTRTRAASAADRPSCDPNTRRISGSPPLTSSTRRPTHTPSILRRCVSSSSVSMLRTTAQTRGGSASRQTNFSAAWSNVVTACAK